MEHKEIYIIIGAFAIISFVIAIYNKRNLMEKIRSSWGILPRYYNNKFYSENELKRATKILMALTKDKKIVDDITWRDLDMFQIFNQMNKTYSSVGAEALYFRLRNIRADEFDQKYINSLMDFFDKNTYEREKAQYYFAKIGKLEDNRVLDFVVTKKEKKFYGLTKHVIMGLIPLVAIIVIILQTQFNLLTNVGVIPLFVLVAAVIYNFSYTAKQRELMEADYKTANYLTSTIYFTKKILHYDIPLKDEIEKVLKPLSKISRLSFLTFSESSNIMSMLTYVLNTVFMINFISFTVTIRKLRDHRDDIIKLWTLVGDLDASIAVLNYQKATKDFCHPEFIEGQMIKATDLYHPLIKNPVPNDVNWTKSTLVTGSNASGKSTYVKSIAINAILAQTIYMATAREFKIKKGRVYSSMAIKDDVLAGDSYFIAEIKSLKRIVDNIEKDNFAYYFIDEILRGTNTVERISASASIIDFFIQHNVLAFVATHDIELTKLFENKVENIHFRESVDDENGVTFDYKLQPGPSNSKNAIRLLESLNFPASVTNLANKRVKGFEESGVWE